MGRGANCDWTNYIGQVSWLLFLRYLESNESDHQDQAAFESSYIPILMKNIVGSMGMPKNGLGVRDDLEQRGDILIGKS